MVARYYWELECWQLANELKLKVYAFARFLEIARGSLAETHNHLRDGLDLNYLTEAECAPMFKLCDRASGATTNLLRYLRRCRRYPRPVRT